MSARFKAFNLTFLAAAVGAIVENPRV